MHVSFHLFSSFPYVMKKLPFFSPVQKICKGYRCTVCFCGVEDVQKRVLFNLNQFAHCVGQHGLRVVLAQQGYSAPGCREQGEGQKEEKREQELLSLTVLSKPVCCGIVV